MVVSKILVGYRKCTERSYCSNLFAPFQFNPLDIDRLIGFNSEKNVNFFIMKYLKSNGKY